MSSIQIKSDTGNDEIFDFLITNIKVTLSSNFNFITKTFLIMFILLLFFALELFAFMLDVLRIAIKIAIVFCAVYFVAWLLGYDLIEIISSFI